MSRTPAATVNLYLRIWTHPSGGASLATDGPIAVDVVNGPFSAPVDFGSSVFDGNAVWLDVDIEYPTGTWTLLSPRQNITPAPYALFAAKADSLALPYSALANGTATPFSVTQIGSGRAVTFGTNNSSADESTLVVIHGGRASAGEFWNNNSSNDEAALFASSGSTGPGVFGQNVSGGPAVSGTARGSGRAASFLTESSTNSSPTLHAKQQGTGRCAEFRTTQTSNAAATVYATQQGIGRCGHFRITNAANDLASVSASTTGDGAAVSGYTIGGGSAGYFEINSSNSDAPAVHAKTDGTGYALHADSTDDVAPSGGGVVMVGRETGINVAIDGNEIMARNNGGISPLFVNNEGGDVVFGGAIDIGYEIVSNTEEDTDTATAICSAGKKVIGGGCYSNTSGNYIEGSEPLGGGTGWRCRCRYSIVFITARATCANVK